jgi:hypothetical protein
MELENPPAVPVDEERRGPPGSVELHVGDDPGQPPIRGADLEADAMRQPVAPDGARRREPASTGTGHWIASAPFRNEQIRISGSFPT